MIWFLLAAQVAASPPETPTPVTINRLAEVCEDWFLFGRQNAAQDASTFLIEQRSTEGDRTRVFAGGTSIRLVLEQASPEPTGAAACTIELRGRDAAEAERLHRLIIAELTDRGLPLAVRGGDLFAQFQADEGTVSAVVARIEANGQPAIRAHLDYQPSAREGRN